MSDYLPDMVAPPRPPTPPTPPEDENVHIPDNINDKILDEDITDDQVDYSVNEIDDIYTDEEPTEMIIPKREKMKNDDIFKGPKIQPIKLSKEEKAEERRIAREAAKVAEKERKLQEREEKKLAKAEEKARLKAARPKRKMDPAHLEKLQAGRLKAQETRERNKKLREQGADIPKPLTRKEKELKHVVESVIEPRKSKNDISKADLEEAQFQAIQRYEQIRKKRKADKKKKEQEDNLLQQNTATIHRAVNPHPPQKDIWDHALGGMFS